MSKQEFLNTLEATLKSGLPEIIVREHVAYYNDYINSEISKGRSEEDVMEELGDPRLLAKNILATARESKSTVYEEPEQRESGEHRESQGHSFVIRKPGWQGILTLIVVALIALLVIALVIGLIIGILKIFIFVVLPIAVVAGIILFVMSLVKK